jgi:hypothetical protein
MSNTEKKYILLTHNMPLGFELDTLEKAKKDLAWQLSGQPVDESIFCICRVSKGVFTNIANGEQITPMRGVWTAEAWARNLIEYANA